MTITVTEDDIQQGIAGNACACPIARAVRRVTGAGYVSVGEDDVDTAPSLEASHHDRQHYELPAEAEWFVALFDQGGLVNPFSFELTKPEMRS